jgi:hypothetical protein
METQKESALGYFRTHVVFAYRKRGNQPAAWSWQNILMKKEPCVLVCISLEHKWVIHRRVDRGLPVATAPNFGGK